MIKLLQTLIIIIKLSLEELYLFKLRSISLRHSEPIYIQYGQFWTQRLLNCLALQSFGQFNFCKYLTFSGNLGSNLYISGNILCRHWTVGRDRLLIYNSCRTNPVVSQTNYSYISFHDFFFLILIKT
jgi:hypothetical protein